jgi:hypothetical protein
MVPDARRLCTHGRRDLALGVGRLGAGQCNASSSARLSGGRPRPHAWRSAPAPRGPSRERALAPSPRGIASVGGPSPWTSDGRGLPARAVRTLDPGRTCSRERSCPMPSSAAGQGRALRGARAATRGQRAGRRRSRRRATDGATRPLFADGRPGVGLSSCTRRCHRAARSRASRADSSPRASRRSACAATASASAAMAANSSSRFNAPEPPVADYPTPDASNPRRPGRPPVRRQVTAVAGAPPSHVATRGPIYATASIDTNRAAAGAGS